MKLAITSSDQVSFPIATEGITAVQTAKATALPRAWLVHDSEIPISNGAPAVSRYLQAIADHPASLVAVIALVALSDHEHDLVQVTDENWIICVPHKPIALRIRLMSKGTELGQIERIFDLSDQITPEQAAAWVAEDVRNAYDTLVADIAKTRTELAELEENQRAFALAVPAIAPLAERASECA